MHGQGENRVKDRVEHGAFACGRVAFLGFMDRWTGSISVFSRKKIICVIIFYFIRLYDLTLSTLFTLSTSCSLLPLSTPVHPIHHPVHTRPHYASM